VLALIASSFAEEGSKRGIMPYTSVPTVVAAAEATLDTSTSTKRSRSRDAKPSCFGEDDAGQKQTADGNIDSSSDDQVNMLELSEQAVPGDYGQFFMKLVPGIHGKLYGRTLVAPCRCEGD
jgi:hypothetical protein